MPANVLSSIIESVNAEQIKNRYNEKFLDYLVTENGGISIHNILWYVENMVANTKPSGDVLDFGCGFGLHSILFRIFSPAVNDIVGVDIDADKISVFTKLVEETKLKSIIPRTILSEESFPFPDDTFDTVYCNEVFSHIDDREKALNEIYRVLKVGGKIIIADCKRWNWWVLYFIYLRGHSDERYITISKMKELLVHAGFTDICRVKGIVAPRNLLRKWSRKLWFLHKYIDPKYVLLGQKYSSRK